ncbi:hypothetical protein [Nitratidesulfovibrio sp. 1201_IL3209]|uniref:hypothetical protein n=1 Tax=Nitratidesulfovibrio sp. 1201_IL3209 TaxID=3084053 RepID=UPI0002275C42|nr:hypothetical protein DA2_3194 [Desulfovibrio sp. A2]
MIPGLLEAITTVGGMILPPVVDLVRKKVLGKDDDSPERTLATLATTKPEVMADYVRATAESQRAQAEFFNRDVSGTPSQWVVDLRAAIRPAVTVAAVVVLAVGYFLPDAIDEGTRVTFCGIAGSWFGDRISIGRRAAR